MTLEDEDKTELRKIPAKSILKNRQSQIVAESPNVPNQGASDHLIKFHDRRVSFANKVKLHQIDFVPVPRESGESDLDDNSMTSDLDDSFLKIEEDTDMIVEAMVEQEAIAEQEVTEQEATEQEATEQEANGSQSDQETMELTGQIEVFGETFQKINEHKGDSTEEPAATNATDSGTIADHTENPELSNVEEDMELTAPMSSQIQKAQNSQTDALNTLPGEASAERHLAPGTQTRLDIQATSTQNDDYPVRSITPERVSLSKENEKHNGNLVADQQEEVTMDLTTPNIPNNLAIQLIEDKSVAVAAAENKDDANDQQTEEITMDITKTFEGPITAVKTVTAEKESAELPESSDFEEDVPMELTQPITTPKISDRNVILPQNGTIQEERGAPQESTKTSSLDTAKQKSSAGFTDDESREIQSLHAIEQIGNQEIPETHDTTLQKTVEFNEEFHNIGHELSSDSVAASPHLPSPDEVQTPIEPEANAPDIFAPAIQQTDEATPKYKLSTVQQQTSTPDMDGNNGSLKRKADLQEARVQKKSQWEAHVVTSTIPLADVSTLSWDDDDGWGSSIPHFSLTNFLEEVGIKFYDDLDFSTDFSTSHRLSLDDSKEENSKEDYYRANIQLPLLEVYGLSCKELTGKIQQGKKLYDELQEKTLSDNPELFKQYYRASYYDQMGMKARFHLLKEYTRQQAKLIWYQWRSKLIENILDVLLNNLEVLQSDKATILNNISILDEVYEEIQQKFVSLRLEVQQFKEIQDRFKDLDADQIKKIKLQLTELNNKLIEHKQKIAQKEQELQQLGKQIQERTENIANLRIKLTEAENQLNNTKHFNTTEIGVLEYKSKLLQAAAGIKFVRSISPQVDEFEFNSELGLRIDFSKPDSPESSTFHLLDPQCKLLYNRSLLEYYCSDLVEATGFTNVFDSVINLRKKWIKLAEFDRDIYKISLRYPVKIIKNEKKDMQFEFQFFSFKNNFKAHVVVSLPVYEILQYPQAVQIKAKKLREGTDPNDEEILEKEARLFLPDSIVPGFTIALKG